MQRSCSLFAFTSTSLCLEFKWKRILATSLQLTQVSVSKSNGLDLEVCPFCLGVDNFFSTVSYRYGHSEVGDIIFRLDDNGNEISEGHVPLFEAFFYPTFALNAGKGIFNACMKVLGVNFLRH